MSPSPLHKRQRIDSDPSSESTGDPKKSSDFWFSDGTLILITRDGTTFRVHKGVLAQNSEVFRDMFSLPAVEPSVDENIDGCPVVHVDDTAEQWVDVLTAFYRGALIFGDHRTITFNTVLSMLELGTKYRIAYVREEAMRRMRQLFPPSLADFPHHYIIYSKEFRPRDTKTVSVVIDHYMCYSAVSMVRRLNLDTFLPPILYICAQSSVEEMFTGLSSGEWTIDDLQLCMQGIEPMMDDRIAGYAPLFRHELDADCRTPSKCKTSITRFLQYKGAGMGHGVPDVLFIERPLALLKNMGMCLYCLAHYATIFEKLRKEIWNKLGGYFGVEPWPPVENESQSTN
ncbi:hypothetical protein K474DRAFT_1657180 [Panus rudis PR-1116 ss-1]|nr:hypothetical protein K474DRAFT_1657180 [Panus rudis PR-1116 ss-1]